MTAPEIENTQITPIPEDTTQQQNTHTLTRRELLQSALAGGVALSLIAAGAETANAEADTEVEYMRRNGLQDMVPFYKNMRILEYFGAGDQFAGRFLDLREAIKGKDDRRIAEFRDNWLGTSFRSFEDITAYVDANIKEDFPIRNLDASKDSTAERAKIVDMIHKLSFIYPKISGVLVGKSITINGNARHSQIMLDKTPDDVGADNDYVRGYYKALAHETFHRMDSFQGELHKPENLAQLKRLFTLPQYAKYLEEYTGSLCDMIKATKTMTEEDFISQKQGEPTVMHAFNTYENMTLDEASDRVWKIAKALATADSKVYSGVDVENRKNEYYYSVATHSSSIQDLRVAANRLFYRSFQLMWHFSGDKDSSKAILEDLKPIYSVAIDEFSHDMLGSINFGDDFDPNAANLGPSLKARKRMELATLQFMGHSAKSANTLQTQPITKRNILFKK